jgi:hypothetical protein
MILLYPSHPLIEQHTPTNSQVLAIEYMDYSACGRDAEGMILWRQACKGHSTCNVKL